ncbi:MAG: DUF7347 domain-containing protein [Candidatus Ranarchaeia archaeon]
MSIPEKSSLITNEEYKQIQHPIRQTILYELNKEPIRFNELSRKLSVEKSNLAYHIRQMGPFITKQKNFYTLSELGKKILKNIETSPKSILKDTVRYGINIITIFAYMSGISLGIGAGLLTRLCINAVNSFQIDFTLAFLSIPVFISGILLYTQIKTLVLFFSPDSRELPEMLIHAMGLFGGWFIFFLSLPLLIIAALTTFAPVSLIMYKANFEYAKNYFNK